MGILDGLSAGLTAATQGMGGYLQGQEKGRKEQEAKAMAAAQMLRQHHLDEQNRLLQSAQIRNYDQRSEPQGFTLSPGQKRFDANGLPLATGGDDEETFTGQPSPMVQNGNPVMAIRGSKGTVRVIPGMAPYAAPQKDVAPRYQILKDDATGKYSRVRVDGPEGPLAETFTRSSTGGGTGSGQGAQAPLDDMMQRYAEIEQHGKDLGDKKFKFTNTNTTREALQFGQSYAQAEGKPAIGAQIGQGMMDMFGLAKGTSEDQRKYAALMASTRAFGDDAAKVFKGRQGFQNISLEVAQATLRPEDYGNPAIIAQKLNRMRHVVKLAALVAPGQAQAADPAKLARFMSDLPSATAGKPNPEY